MSKKDKEIAQLIQDIVNPNRGKQFPIYSGKVVAGSVDNANCTCSVERSIDDAGSPLTKVLTNVVIGNNLGFHLLPSGGADCLVCEIDGGDKFKVLWASKYDYVKVSGDSSITLLVGNSELVIDGAVCRFNGGSLGGMVKLQEVTDKLNAVENKINDLITAINTWVIVPSDGGAALKTALTTWLLTSLNVTVPGDLENDKVKQ